MCGFFSCCLFVLFLCLFVGGGGLGGRETCMRLCAQACMQGCMLLLPQCVVVAAAVVV